MDIGKNRMLKHLPQLKRYAKALTGDDAKGIALTDKTMDCAASLVNFIPKDMPLQVWLFSVMHNLTVDFLSEYYDDVSSQSILPYIRIEDLSADHVSDIDDMKTALANLTLEQKETVLLIGLEKFSYSEICQVMAYNNKKLVECLDTARSILCEHLFSDQFDDLQQIQ